MDVQVCVCVCVPSEIGGESQMREWSSRREIELDPRLPSGQKSGGWWLGVRFGGLRGGERYFHR